MKRRVRGEKERRVMGQEAWPAVGSVLSLTRPAPGLPPQEAGTLKVSSHNNSSCPCTESMFRPSHVPKCFSQNTADPSKPHSRDEEIEARRSKLWLPDSRAHVLPTLSHSQALPKETPLAS